MVCRVNCTSPYPKAYLNSIAIYATYYPRIVIQFIYIYLIAAATIEKKTYSKKILHTNFVQAKKMCKTIMYMRCYTKSGGWVQS